MSKKKSGLLIAFGAMLGGAVAAGISYYLKLKSFNDELDQDFHEYEDEETPSEEKEEKTEKILTDFLTEKPITVRCRTHKYPQKEIYESLVDQGVEVKPAPYLPYAYEIYLQILLNMNQ